MKILAIETSCDETAFTLLGVNEADKSAHFAVLAHQVRSQVEEHAPYGGVYPNIAKREHAKNAVPMLSVLLDDSVEKSTETISEEQKESVSRYFEHQPEVATALIEYTQTHTRPAIDYIAVTYGPGLEPALWVGINVARSLAVLWGIPVIPVNHMEGHVFSVFANTKEFSLPEIEFPLLALLVSGGHTEFDLAQKGAHASIEYKRIGHTVDDAIGESFDKVGRLLGLPYPGGPKISALAKQARDEGISPDEIPLPSPMIHTHDLDFSFSGLKTAVRREIEKKETIDEHFTKALALSFEEAVVKVLVKKTRGAIDQTSPKCIVIAGGVSANRYIQKKIEEIAREYEIPFYTPELDLATDNSIMIGVAGYVKIQQHIQNNIPFPDLESITADGGVAIDGNVRR